MKEKESLKDLLKRIFLQSAGCFGSTIVNILKGFVMVGIFLFVQSIIPESPDRELKYSQRVINKAKRATVAYLNDYDNVIDFPELNESREVLNRMAGEMCIRDRK